ncbi:MAG: DMP19 family protein [Pseudolabrys sp.]
MPFESDQIAAKLNELFLEAYSWEWSKDLRPAEQALVAIWPLEQEVYNGGFLQYCQNQSDYPEVAPVAEQLNKIGMTKAAAIVERALALARSHMGTGSTYVSFLDLPKPVQDEIPACEREFYKTLDEVNAALFRYILSRRDEIDAPSGYWTESIQ